MTLDFTQNRWRNSLTDAVTIDSRAVQLNTSSVERALTRFLPDVEKDFVEIAMAVYVADRALQRAPGGTKSWVKAMTGRSISIRLGVRRPQLWSEPEVYDKLIQTLYFLTADDWSFDFVGRSPESQPPLPFDQELPHSFVGLFSGGLDSYAGAVIQALESQSETGVLVAAYSNEKLLNRQSHILGETNQLLRNRNKRLVHVPLPHRLERFVYQNFPVRSQENSQRSRGFLFTALGIAVARALKLNELHVYENGIGAINLPQTLSGLGVDYTRAMHPESLLNISDLASTVFQEAFQIRNESLWKTKGFMCRQIQEYEFGHLAVQTVSCDGFGGRRKPKNKEQCGLCTSCLLRRISFAAGNLIELDKDEQTYEADVYNMSPRAQKDKLLPLRCMEAQAVRLQRALSLDDTGQNLIRVFPELLRARIAIAKQENRSAENVLVDLNKLYGSYLKDWSSFSLFLPHQPHSEVV